MVYVYNDNNKIIGQVKYNNNLDNFDGHVFSCGCFGRHKGLCKLKNGKFALIYGTDWFKESNYAQVISRIDAAQEIIKSGNIHLLQDIRFKELKPIVDNILYGEFSEM